MKAIVYHDYGSPDVLQLEEIEKSTPGDKEVLIKVRAASVNPLDWHFIRGTPYIVRIVMTGLRKPKNTRLGVDVAGQVEAVGSAITQFKPGDEVFGTCRGAFAEYVCISESNLVIKPNNVTFEQAAAVPIAAFTALQGLRDKGKIQPGQKILVNGASGGIGTFAVQIAKSYGADVTGVCSTRNIDMVRSIGADQVIDYTKEDFTKSSQRYDLIFDAIGNHSLSARRRLLTPSGICVMAGGPSGRWKMGLASGIKALVWSQCSSRKLTGLLAKSSEEDLTILHDLMATGKVTPVIDRQYSLSELPDAIRYLEQGHARGKVVITL
ncbi:NADPH:quinone reductase-like Zn-dependent oxidoreductase [Edaphobacter aggregans]|uniref:NADPH:quinone reductase-like Zn-dependent oxidoreductase n=1 Tax=Edaphobacter aggregans TaxID=570835 RepID=A0A428MIK2_9BACT|nr:NAD(P)-dependent alcohol dehydrogenase [Edaphobacter aggregans]RSL16755.1 NADPH:quinone reductase-like Zn-dependent oxidoreductase [Edaphobacter aggregans]